MITIITRKFKEHSHIPIEKIKKMQNKHRKDLIQPRIGGEINPDFVKEYGSKNIRVSEHDIKKMERKSPKLARELVDKFKKQNAN